MRANQATSTCGRETRIQDRFQQQKTTTWKQQADGVERGSNGYGERSARSNNAGRRKTSLQAELTRERERERQGWHQTEPGERAALPLVHHHLVQPAGGCQLCVRPLRLVISLDMLPQRLARWMLLTKVSIGRDTAAVVRRRRRRWELDAHREPHLPRRRRRHLVLVHAVRRLDHHLYVRIALEQMKLVRLDKRIAVRGNHFEPNRVATCR